MTIELIKKILELADYQNMISPMTHPAQGQFVTTGPSSGDNSKRLGYCLQVRKRRGQFGSDMVFLRHADGSISTHENQCYIALIEEQFDLATSIFTVLPRDEDYSLGYRCCGGIREIGFVIENSDSTPIPDVPFTITVYDQVKP